MTETPRVTVMESEEGVRIRIAPSRRGRDVFNLVFWFVAWAFGLALFAFLLSQLVSLTTVRLGGPVDFPLVLLLVATFVLLLWVMVWMAGGIYLLYHALFACRGTEEHLITPDHWRMMRRISRWRTVLSFETDRVFDVGVASETADAGLLLRYGTPSKNRRVGFGMSATNAELGEVLEVVGRVYPYLMRADGGAP